MSGYNTPQRCEVCSGEFKRPQIQKVCGYWICKFDLEQIVVKAIKDGTDE